MSVETLTSFISGGVGAVAVLGIIFALFLSGKLHSDDEFQREVARGDKEQERGDRLEEAAVELRRALTEANARADSAVRSSELIANVLAGQDQRPALDRPRTTERRRRGASP